MSVWVRHSEGAGTIVPSRTSKPHIPEDLVAVVVSAAVAIAIGAAVAARGYRVMVTSAVEGEGKSIMVANLGVAFAQEGSKVLLVDLDFRRSSLPRFRG